MSRKVKVVSHISVGEFFENHGENLKLEPINSTDGFNRKILEPTLNRPGLALAGFMDVLRYEMEAFGVKVCSLIFINNF